MADNTKKLVDFIEALTGFEYVSNSDGNYEHMGAIIVDGILQAGLKYETVVKPRVLSVLEKYPNNTTSSSFITVGKEQGIKNIISWKNDKKPNLIMLLLSFLQSEQVETCQQFSTWLEQENNILKLRSIKGIGPKTIDYLKILLGKETVAVDIHLKRFVQMAGIELSNYDEIKTVITETANHLNISPSQLDHSIWKYMAERE